jgi:hypothetical protein
MSNKLPPAPVGVPPGHSFWNDWYEKLRSIVNATGGLFTALNFTGSNITSIATRLHDSLQGISGGALGDYQHLTSAQVALIGTGSAAGSTTQVQINNAGAFGAFSTFAYDSGTNTVTFGNITGSALGMTIQPKAPTITDIPLALSFSTRTPLRSNTNAPPLNFVTGNGTGIGSGGAISFTSGSGQSGGPILFSAGQGLSSGGSFQLVSGDATNANGFGGSFIMQAGNASASGGSGGDFTFLSGGGGSVGVGARSGLISLQPPNGATYCFQGSDNFPTGSDTTIRFFAIGDGSDLVKQQTTATASATRAAVIGTFANVGDTYDGYTLAQVVKALRNYGLLA